MNYLLSTLVFQKKYFINDKNNDYDDSFVRCQLINKDIYDIYQNLLVRDIHALKLQNYLSILQFTNLSFLRQLFLDKNSYTYIIESIGSLEFMPEFNYFNKKFEKENLYYNNIYVISLRNIEIEKLDIFKPYKSGQPYEKRRLLNRLSKLGLHYPIMNKNRYRYTF